MQFRSLKYVFLLALLSNALVSCGQHVSETSHADSLAKTWDKTIPGNFSGQSKLVFDSLEISRFFENYPGVKDYKAQVQDFYNERKFAYVWFDDRRLIEQAGNLTNRIMNLKKDGLYQVIPYQKELDSLVNLQEGQKQPGIKLELMLTAQYFAFSKLAWGGMNSSASRASGWNLPRKKLDYNQYLDSLLKTPVEKFAAEEPVYRQYELLKEFLRKYRELDANNSWLPISLKKLPKPGDSSVVVLQVKERLFKLTDFRGDTLNNQYESTLLDAIKLYQDRHGLLVNGLLNKETIAELNIPIKTRIKQIIVNMERSRWLPITLNADYLAVNIPEFKLHVYHADSLLWSCNVVVGQAAHQTTLFYGEIKYVVFSPYWNVPASIVLNEILPGIKKDPAYISRHNMEITGHLNGLPVVRQKPGPENSLGLVKFLFPNRYNTYLHDTPSKSLFGETTRAFSHGCIRIVEPVKLAKFLLKNRKEWNAERVDRAMHSGKEQYVTLDEKVPVFIAYFTAFTDRNNRLNFRKDVYQLDARLASTILSGNDAN